MSIPINVISRSIERGRTLFFLGAGASLAGVPKRSRVPGGYKLAERLKVHLGTLPSGPPDTPSLSQVAMYYEQLVQRNNLLTTIHDEFKKSKTARSLPYAHSLIAKVAKMTGKKQIVLTTNYDHYMERAFKLNGIPYISVSHITNPNHACHTQLSIFDETNNNYLMPSSEFDMKNCFNKSVIYKIHGNLPEPASMDQDQVVLSEIDYYNFSAVHMRQMPRSIISKIKSQDVLYLGYSLIDWNFRLFLYAAMSNEDKNLLSNSSGTANWAVSKNFDWFEDIFWEKFHVKTFGEDLEVVIPKMASKLGISL
ncbi:MAG: SIR2 family protein [Candidatus Thiodiazotropha endolucinida]